MKKLNYWKGLYAPKISFEDFCLVPLLYLFLIGGISLIVILDGFEKIIGIMVSGYLLYLIIYDLIYKIKLMNSNDEIVNDDNLQKSSDIVKNLITLIGGIIIVVIFTITFFRTNDVWIKLGLIFPLLLATTYLSYAIVKLLNKEILVNAYIKTTIGIFLIFWFLVIIFFAIIIITNGTELIQLLILIPFIIFGLYMLYSTFIKKR